MRHMSSLNFKLNLLEHVAGRGVNHENHMTIYARIKETWDRFQNLTLRIMEKRKGRKKGTMRKEKIKLKRELLNFHSIHYHST